MTDEKRDTEGQSGAGSQTGGADDAGDPGRTPGAAEGDRETVEEDLKDKENEARH